MMKKTPAFLQYEFTELELIEELQNALKKKHNVEAVLGVLDWDEDGDFTIVVDEIETDEFMVERIDTLYGEVAGGGLTEGLLGDLFGVKTTFNNLKTRQDSKTYYVSVRLSEIDRYKEAWAQADAIQETLDVVMNPQEAWDNSDVLMQRALAVCKLIGDLVPEDMSDYEPVEDPRSITNQKDELIII